MKQTLRRAHNASVPILGFILNKVSASSQEAQGYGYGYGYAPRKRGDEPMGVLNPSGLHRKPVAALPAISSFPQAGALLLGDALSLLGVYSLTYFLLPIWG